MKTRKFENVIIDVTDHFNDGFESPVPIAVLLNPDGTNAYDRYVRCDILPPPKDFVF